MASEEVIVKMDSVELGVEEEEAPDAETSPRANPCEMINGLVQPDSAAMALVARLSDAAAKVRGAFAAPALGRDYAQVEVVGVGVEATEGGGFQLKARTRFEGCSVELVVAGAGLTRTRRDFV